MKAKDYNGTIKVFETTPKSYGNIFTGFDLLSDSELENHGFYDVLTPTYDTRTQELGDIYFDSTNNYFTYPVDNKSWTDTLSELKQRKVAEVKDEANMRLKITDWIIIRDLELGNTTTQSILNERASIRTTCANHETAINAKTTKAQVLSYDILF